MNTMKHRRALLMTFLLGLTLAPALPPAAGEEPPSAAPEEPPAPPASADSAAPVESAGDEAERPHISLGAGHVVEVRVDRVYVADAGGFRGRFVVQLGDAAPKVLPVAGARGEELRALASFVARGQENSVLIALYTDANVTALIVDGTLQPTLVFRVLEVNKTLVRMSALDSSVRISTGTVDGHFEVTALYKSYQGHRRFLFGASPAAVPRSAATSGTAPVPNATLQINASEPAPQPAGPPASIPESAMLVYAGEGPELRATYRVTRGPLTLDYRLVVQDEDGAPVLTWSGSFSWVDSVVLGASVHKADNAPQLLRSVTLRPVRETNFTTWNIPNSLLLKEVEPSHSAAPADPYAVSVILCGEPCPGPEPPWSERVAAHLAAAARHLPLLLLAGALVAVLVALLLLRRGQREAERAKDAPIVVYGRGPPDFDDP